MKCKLQALAVLAVVVDWVTIAKRTPQQYIYEF